LNFECYSTNQFIQINLA